MLQKFDKDCIRSAAKSKLVVKNVVFPDALKFSVIFELSRKHLRLICKFGPLSYSTSVGSKKFWLTHMQMRCRRSFIWNSTWLSIFCDLFSFKAYMENLGSWRVSSKTWYCTLFGYPTKACKNGFNELSTKKMLTCLYVDVDGDVFGQNDGNRYVRTQFWEWRVNNVCFPFENSFGKNYNCSDYCVVACRNCYFHVGLKHKTIRVFITMEINKYYYFFAPKCIWELFGEGSKRLVSVLWIFLVLGHIAFKLSVLICPTPCIHFAIIVLCSIMTFQMYMGSR